MLFMIRDFPVILSFNYRMAWFELLKPWTILLFISQLTDSCPDESWRPINNECFKIMDSPRFFGNASVICLETGGVLLSYKNRHVLRDLDVTSSTWLENSQKMDNITYGAHPSQWHRNITSSERCPIFSPNSTLITFNCDALSRVVCQLEHSDTETAKGIHLKLLVAIAISGFILVIFLALLIYSAKRRLDDVEGRESNTVTYGKYRHLHQTEEEKCKTFTENAIELKDIPTVVKGEQSNGVPGEESVQIKRGKYVQFSVPSTESEHAIFNT